MSVWTWVAIGFGVWSAIVLVSLGGVLWAIAHAVEIQDELQ